jgi:hypothetical protein
LNHIVPEPAPFDDLDHNVPEQTPFFQWFGS